MVKNLKKLAYLGATLLILSACNSQHSSDNNSTKGAAFQDESLTNNHEANQPDENSRKLIKTGEIKFESKDAKDTRQDIAKLTNKYRGYIGEDNVMSFDDRIEYQIEVRVPANNFDAFINELTSGLDHIEYQDISITDVTSRYIDLEARLKSKKALEERYLKLLEKANKVEDMLKIEEEIEQVRSDIESMQAQLKHLSKNVAFSKLEITFYEYTGQSSSLGRKAGKAFVKGWNMLLEVLVGLLNIWPFLIIIGLVIYFIIRYDKKTKQRIEQEKQKD